MIFTLVLTNEFHFITHKMTQKKRESNNENIHFVHVVYSKSIIWIVSSAPLWFWHLLATLIRGIIMHVNEQEHESPREKKTRANNKFYQPWKSSSSSSSSSPQWWSLPAPSYVCVLCVCGMFARKKGDHRNDKRSDSLWLLTMIANNRTVTRSNGHWTCWTWIVLFSLFIYFYFGIVARSPNFKNKTEEKKKKRNQIKLNRTQPNQTEPK